MGISETRVSFGGGFFLVELKSEGKKKEKL